MTATLPAVAALAATATLPAVAVLPATAMLPVVAVLPATAMLPAVAVLPATAMLPVVAMLPATAMLPGCLDTAEVSHDRGRRIHPLITLSLSESSDPATHSSTQCLG